MVTIRRERPSDVAAVDALLRRAFDDDLPARLARALRAAGLVDPRFTCVATDREDLVGQVMFSWLTVHGETTFDALNLTPLAVAPARQGEGIARVLVEHALDAIEVERCTPLVVIEGDPRHYARYGFRRASDAGLERPSPRIPDPAFQFIPTSGYDAQVHRGAVAYPQPFHDLGLV
jgi:putative acetyltransferase